MTASAPIERLFRELPEKPAADPAFEESIKHQYGFGGIGWETLLKSSRILIISEAGTGKSYECRRTQEALWRRGEAAYVLDLADLATTDLRVLLSPNPERFDDWASQAASVATFFLDSYDELKMTRGKFEQALNRMASALSGNLHRARVVTTTAQSSAELLRLLGATVPAIDGPSADDRQFD